MEYKHAEGYRGYTADDFSSASDVCAKEKFQQTDCRHQDKGRGVADKKIVVLGFA